MVGDVGKPARPLLELGQLVTVLRPGSLAPAFTAAASDGKTYQLQRMLQESRVLLVFYPGNNTPD